MDTIENEVEIIAEVNREIGNLVSLVTSNAANLTIEDGLSDLDRLLLASGQVARIGAAFRGRRIDEELAFISFVRREAGKRLGLHYQGAERGTRH